MYKQGMETEEKIIKTGKKLFYEKGFADTSISSIMNEAGLRRTLFFYYFKDNFELASFIYNTFQDTHFNLIHEIIDPMNLCELEKACIRGASHQRLVISDKKVSRFISQVSYNGAIQENEFIKTTFDLIAKQYIPPQKKITGEYLAAQNLALSACIFRSNAEGTLHSPVEELVELKVESILRNCYLPDDEAERMKKHILEIEKILHFKIKPYFEVIRYDK